MGRPGSGGGYTVWEREGVGEAPATSEFWFHHQLSPELSFFIGSGQSVAFLPLEYLEVTLMRLCTDRQCRVAIYMYTHTHTRDIKSHDCHFIRLAWPYAFFFSSNQRVINMSHQRIIWSFYTNFMYSKIKGSWSYFTAHIIRYCQRFRGSTVLIKVSWPGSGFISLNIYEFGS